MGIRSYDDRARFGPFRFDYPECPRRPIYPFSKVLVFDVGDRVIEYLVEELDCEVDQVHPVDQSIADWDLETLAIIRGGAQGDRSTALDVHDRHCYDAMLWVVATADRSPSEALLRGVGELLAIGGHALFVMPIASDGAEHLNMHMPSAPAPANSSEVVAGTSWVNEGLSTLETAGYDTAVVGVFPGGALDVGDQHHSSSDELLELLLEHRSGASANSYTAVVEAYTLADHSDSGLGLQTARDDAGEVVFIILQWREISGDYDDSHSVRVAIPFSSAVHELSVTLPPSAQGQQLRIFLPRMLGSTSFSDLRLLEGPRTLWRYEPTVGVDWDARSGGTYVVNRTDGISCLTYQRSAWLEPSFVLPAHTTKSHLELTVCHSNDGWSRSKKGAYAIELRQLAIDHGAQLATKGLFTEMQMLRARVRYLERRVSEVAKVEREKEELLEKLRELRERESEIYRSRSWRVTAPLRLVSQIRRRSVLRVAENPTRSDDLDAEASAVNEALLPRTWDSSDPHEYADWITTTTPPELMERGVISQYVARHNVSDRITMIVAVPAQSSMMSVRQSLDAMLHQIYENWETIVVVDYDCDAEVRDAVDTYADADPRFVVVSSEAVVTYASLLNLGIDTSKGTFVGYLQPGDVLPPHALAWYASEISAHPGVAIVYSDHDYLVSPYGRQDPQFKPNWNPELLLGANYISRSMLIARELLERVGHFGSDYEYAPEWDLLLRASRTIGPNRIRHIPAILHHMDPACSVSDAAMGVEARRVQERFLLGEGLPYQLVESALAGIYLPVFGVRGRPKVSIIIPTRNGLEDLYTCIGSVRSTAYDNYEIVVVNNQSSDPQVLEYLHTLSSTPGFRVIDYPFPFSYADLHNYVVPLIDTDYLCLLNNDTEIIDPNWLGVMLGFAQRDGVGAVGAKLLYPNRQIQHAGVVLGPGGLVAHVNRSLDDHVGGYMNRALLPQNFSAVTAACMLIRKSHWELVGGMSVRLPIAYNDVDLCLRLVEAGLRNVYLPHVKVIHHESKSRGIDLTFSQQYRSMRESGYLQWRWGHLLKHDPAYNTNLSLFDEYCRLGEPRTNPPWSTRFEWMRLPDGFNNASDQCEYVLPNQELHFTCVLPQHFTGSVGALRFGVKNVVGATDGLAVLRVNLNGEEAVSVQPLDNLAKGATVTFEFDSHQLISVSTGGTLYCAFALVRATFPVGLPTYPSSDDWSHQLDGLSAHALHVELGYLGA
ncbi:MAG: glycosyltransferase family 2 protein [Ferrimicrobium sp.]